MNTININFTNLFKTALEKNASDLHLSAGMPPVLRIAGQLQFLGEPILESSDIAELLTNITDHNHADFLAKKEIDFAFNLALDELGARRFRANVFQQRNGLAAAFRLIPEKTLALSELYAPDIIKTLLDIPQGLILVTGATGSGKSTTLAAMIRHLNESCAQHILTIEDPIEFLHTSQKSLINQREVGRDTASFSAALRAGLREDPDVILVGELRDLETIRLALSAAETGHLVLATLHTMSAVKTIDRLVEVFPAGEKDTIRLMVSESLRAVIAQTLLPRSDLPQQRVAAYEILVATPAVRNLIRENKTAQLYSTLQTGGRDGMQTLDQGLLTYQQRNWISAQTAQKYMKNQAK